MDQRREEKKDASWSVQARDPQFQSYAHVVSEEGGISLDKRHTENKTTSRHRHPLATAKAEALWAQALPVSVTSSKE